MKRRKSLAVPLYIIDDLSKEYWDYDDSMQTVRIAVMSCLQHLFYFI